MPDSQLDDSSAAPSGEAGRRARGKLEGTVALVTGASSGIGEATAIAHAEEGARSRSSRGAAIACGRWRSGSATRS
jgi:hypothetical protein